MTRNRGLSVVADLLVCGFVFGAVSFIVGCVGLAGGFVSMWPWVVAGVLLECVVLGVAWFVGGDDGYNG